MTAITPQVFEETPGVWRYWLVSGGVTDKGDRGTFISQDAANQSAQAVIALLQPSPTAGQQT